MSDNKKYYYLKLKDDFFGTDEIKILEAMPNGVIYSNLLLKLYLKSLKFNGALRFNEFIPYNEEMISTITNINIDIVRSGLVVLSQMKLIEKLDNGTIYMLNIQNYIGKSSTEADRIRKYRNEIEEEKTKLIEGKDEPNVQMYDKCTPEIENRDRDRDKRLEIITTSSSGLKVSNVQVFKHFEKCGFRLTPLQLEEIAADIEIYSPSWVMDAAKEASNRGKLNYSYVKGILSNWLSKGRENKKEGDKVGTSGTDFEEQLRREGIGL